MKTQRRFRKSGWALVILGSMLAATFWGFVVPVRQASAPDYSPHLSPQGFWEAQERAQRLGVWRYFSGHATGFFGGREWAETIIGWMRDRKESGDCDEDHLGWAMAHITNHHIPKGEGADAEWLRWWEANESRPQEEWIQQGFSEVGITVALPPVKEDWPKLLKVLGAAAGPSQRRYRIVEQLYPDHVCYNAYRWLRDSDFDRVALLMSDEGKSLDWEQWAGLLVYQEHEKILATPPPPGRLGFAPKNDWGWTGRGPEHRPLSLRPMVQAAMTGMCLVMVVGGLWLMGVRVCFARQEI